MTVDQKKTYSSSIKLRGNIKVTEYMEELLQYAAESKKNKEGYWSEHDRLIDPVLISIFYGLYKSRKLPPLEWDDVSAAKTHEFNVDITPYTIIFNHFLFCLWIFENNLPDNTTDIIEYRKKLYSFLENILDQDKWRLVIIPFYLREADSSEEGELSFVYRLLNSDGVKIESSQMSPEFIAMEYNLIQKEFFEEIVESIHKRIFEPE